MIDNVDNISTEKIQTKKLCPQQDIKIQKNDEESGYEDSFIIPQYQFGSKEIQKLARQMDEQSLMLFKKLESHVSTIENGMDVDGIEKEFEMIQQSFPMLGPYLENYHTILSFGDKSKLFFVEELVTLLNMKETTPQFLYTISIVRDVLVDFYFKEIKNIEGLSIENNDRELLIKNLANLEKCKHLLGSTQYETLYFKLIDAISHSESSYKEELKQGGVVKGIYDRDESVYHVFKIGQREVLLPKKRKLLQEKFHREGILYLYISEINNDRDIERIFVSRTHPVLLRFLLKLQVPLVKNDVIKVVTVVRNNGESAKVVVSTEDDTIDPVKLCEEQLESINRELIGEKIEFIRWSKDQSEYLQNLFYPVKILRIEDENDEIHLTVSSDSDDSLLAKNRSNYKLIKKILKKEIVIIKELSPEDLDSWNRLL